MADDADKGKLCTICNTPDISQRNFCDRFEMKFALPLCGMKQVGAAETAAESFISFFYLRL